MKLPVLMSLPSASATPGISFTATPGPTQEMSNKNPPFFFLVEPRELYQTASTRAVLSPN